MPTAVDQCPFGRRPTVVEHRLTNQVNLDRAVQAADGTYQQVIGVVVGRRSGVRGDQVVALPRTHRQGVADQDPTCGRLPRRRQDVRPWLVYPRRRVVDPERPEPEVARLTVEQGTEHAGRVEARKAEPADASVRRDEGARVAVRQERIVRDGREGGRRGSALLFLLPRRGGAHDATHGWCQPPTSATSSPATGGPHDPGV